MAMQEYMCNKTEITQRQEFFFKSRVSVFCGVMAVLFAITVIYVCSSNIVEPRVHRKQETAQLSPRKRGQVVNIDKNNKTFLQFLIPCVCFQEEEQAISYRFARGLHSGQFPPSCPSLPSSLDPRPPHSSPADLYCQALLGHPTHMTYRGEDGTGVPDDHILKLHT